MEPAGISDPGGSWKAEAFVHPVAPLSMKDSPCTSLGGQGEGHAGPPYGWGWLRHPHGSLSPERVLERTLQVWAKESWCLWHGDKGNILVCTASTGALLEQKPTVNGPLRWDEEKRNFYFGLACGMRRARESARAISVAPATIPFPNCQATQELLASPFLTPYHPSEKVTELLQ